MVGSGWQGIAVEKTVWERGSRDGMMKPKMLMLMTRKRKRNKKVGGGHSLPFYLGRQQQQQRCYRSLKAQSQSILCACAVGVGVQLAAWTAATSEQLHHHPQVRHAHFCCGRRRRRRGYRDTNMTISDGSISHALEILIHHIILSRTSKNNNAFIPEPELRR